MSAEGTGVLMSDFERTYHMSRSSWILMGWFLACAFGLLVAVCVWGSVMVVDNGMPWFLLAFIPMGLLSAIRLIDVLIRLLFGGKGLHAMFKKTS